MDMNKLPSGGVVCFNSIAVGSAGRILPRFSLDEFSPTMASRLPDARLFDEELFMRRFAALLVAFSVAFSGLMMVGCGSTADKSAKPDAKKEGHDHDHDHDHAHHGPHGGDIAGVGDEQYHVEWTHDDDSGKVTLYVLDGAAKKEVPITASELVLVTKQGDDAAQEYTLAAVEPKDGKTAQFEIVDKELLGTLETLSEKVTAEVKELDINGEKFSNVPLTTEHHH
jgi:hypothetical protein